jgi:hypothetical protein
MGIIEEHRKIPYQGSTLQFSIGKSLLLTGIRDSKFKIVDSYNM